MRQALHRISDASVSAAAPGRATQAAIARAPRSLRFHGQLAIIRSGRIKAMSAPPSSIEPSTASVKRTCRGTRMSAASGRPESVARLRHQMTATANGARPYTITQA